MAGANNRQLKAAGFKDPVLVAANDGVGTKLRIAIETGRHHGVGIDLVAIDRDLHAIEAEREALMRLCALYLMYHTTHPSGDSVGKFHLTNGATLYRINWAADLSKKGLQQSAGLMVNYLYELDKVEAQHEAFSQGQLIASRSVNTLVS